MRRTLIGVFGLIWFAGIVGWTTIRPTNDREWLPAQRLLADVVSNGDAVAIRNIRNFRWGPGADVRAAWDTRTYSLRDLETVWYVLTPFSQDWRGPAHAFVSFGFTGDRYLSVSVEARRETGEDYSMLRGALKRFEIMYVIADERDLIQLRVGRGDDVYVYPMRASREQTRAMFVDMLERARELRDQPEFYGTLGNNCTTNLLAHVNRIATKKIRYGPRVLLPGYSDQLAYDRGLIDTDLTLEQARARFHVNDRAARYASAVDYSVRIRAVE